MPGRKRLTQALPDARIIPRIRFLTREEKKKGIVPDDKNVDPDVADKLSNIALKAYARANKKPLAHYDDDEPVAVILLPTRALDAVNHFVSEKEFETALPDLRTMIANKAKPSIKRAIANLLEKMPAGGAPPFPQMRRLYCSGGGSEDEWERKFDPRIVREALTRWIELMDQLGRVTGGRRPPIIAEKNFVGALALYWKDELGAQLGNSRSDFAQPNKPAQKGLFADFVLEVSAIIPKAYRPSSWDHAIREILEK